MTVRSEPAPGRSPPPGAFHIRAAVAAAVGPGPVHFVGVGGAGMSGLATILLEAGVPVTGTDAADSAVLARLAAQGAQVQVGHAAACVGQARLLVFSSAVAPDNPEREEARRRGLRSLRRGEFLAELARAFPVVVAVGGSHGKSTTSAMIAHILRETGRRPGFLVGGDVRGWPAPASVGRSGVLVTEVDESDGTQALMRCSHAVITNIDDDHCWSLGGVRQLEACFARFGRSAPRLFGWDSPTLRRLFAKHPGVCLLGDADVPVSLQLGVPGAHNRRNAAVACAVAVALGVSPRAAAAALASFQGVARRLTERYRSPDGVTVIVEDYAHHPVELRATLQALRERYPEHRLSAVFQPHRFERVKRYAREFGRVLDAADEAVVTPPFAAWLADGGIADPRDIVRAMTRPGAVYWDRPLEELAAALAARPAAGPRLLAVVGAGDVGRLAGLLRGALAERWLTDTEAWLRAAFPALALGRRRRWAELTTLGAGTARPLLAEPASEDELRALLRALAPRRVPLFVLGAGSNVVGADWEAPRLVLRLRGEAFCGVRRLAGGRWRVGAGTSLAALHRTLEQAGAATPEVAPLAWIPGTLGGAVRLNAGAHGRTLGMLVRRVTGFRPDGTPWTVAGDAIRWGYRESSLPVDSIITAVELAPGKAAPARAARVYRDSGRQRTATQPQGRSAGCVFRNAGGLAAGLLIERSGCKGWSRGACRVSDQHANFFLTNGAAQERDVLDLLQRVRRTVYETTGVLLMPEVTMAGAGAAAVREQLAASRVVVVKGGPSTERAVSLRSGKAVADALRTAGYEVVEVELNGTRLPRLPRRFDVLFPVLHGAFGEDGQLQALLEARGIPFVGSGSKACAVIMDKLASKACFRAAHVPTPRQARIADMQAPPPAGLRFPLVVKPNCQGSTFGITKVKGPAGGWWRRALKQAFALDPVVFAEEFVSGTEITVAVLEGKALPVVEIVPPKGRMFDYDAKYDHRRGHTHYLCPPEHVPAAAQKRAQRLAERACAALGAKDLLRVDFIVDADGTPWALEGNAIPGFTATSLFPKAAQAAGISFAELCARLVKANL